MGQDTTSSQLATIHVLVTDFENNSKKGEQLLFEGLNSGSVYKGISDEDGKFDIQLQCGDTYLIKIKSIGEAQDYNKLSIPALNDGESYSQMLLTIKFELPKIFTLDNVHESVSNHRRNDRPARDEYAQSFQRSSRSAGNSHRSAYGIS